LRACTNDILVGITWYAFIHDGIGAEFVVLAEFGERYVAIEVLRRIVRHMVRQHRLLSVQN